MELNKNQMITLTIEDIGTEGEGIGFCHENASERGIAVFVKDTVVGDVAEIRIVKVKKNYAYGRLEKVITPSPFRIEAKCPMSRQCGGCQLQMVDYQRQLTFKQDKVRNNLIRIGGFKATLIDEHMEPIVGMDFPFRYRNKAQFPIGIDREGEIIAGFYAGRTHNIIACEDCLLGVKENQDILDIILQYMKENHVAPYNEETGKGLVRHVLIRKGFATEQLMVCLIVNGKKLPFEEKLVQALSKVDNMTSVSLNVNTDNTNVIMGKEELRVLWGTPYIEDRIQNVLFRISPLSFYQVNPYQTEKLYGLALEYAGLTGTETVWDLYCGIGTISLFLAGKAAQVYGVEIIPQAIEDAKKNAELNHLDNTEFYVGKAEEVLPDWYEQNQKRVDVIVVDPPRKGCDEVCLNTMLRMNPEKIVYVSCDSATLARDLKTLSEGGYEIKKIRAVDQFPQTVHVESVVLLTKVQK